jgi:hypothetical protein
MKTPVSYLNLNINQRKNRLKKWTASEMGRKGGKISKRTLTSKEARKMVKKREEKKKNKSP